MCSLQSINKVLGFLRTVCVRCGVCKGMLPIHPRAIGCGRGAAVILRLVVSFIEASLSAFSDIGRQGLF